MKNINWKLLNAAFWIEMVLAYLMPFRVTDNFQYRVGFPVPFLSLYDTKFGVNPFTSMHLDPIGLVADGIIIYLILTAGIRLYQRFRRDHA